MPKIVVRLFAVLLLILCTAQGVLASDIVVLEASARASLVPTAQSGAVYISVAVKGDSADRLLSVSTPVAAMAEIHETIMEGDVMKMRPVEAGWEILPGRIYAMKPGGTHIMLMGLKAPLKKGDTLALELVFEKAGVVKQDVLVSDAVAAP